MVYGGELYVGYFAYYTDNDPPQSHIVRPLSLADTGHVRGYYRLNWGSMLGGWTGGYMAPVPSEWQTALGGKAVTGSNTTSRIQRTSFGPALSRYDWSINAAAT